MIKELTNLIYFATETKMKIENITYVVRYHFDEVGETLKEKTKQLLIEKFHNLPT